MSRLTQWVFLGVCCVSAGMVLFGNPQANQPQQTARKYSPTLGKITITASVKDTRVIDADTIVVDGVRVRFDGISAAERGHSTFKDAKQFVEGLIRAAERIECPLEGRKSFDREVGKCFLIMADGTRVDPQAETVAAGWARDCPRYSDGKYAGYETEASRALPLPKYCQ